MPIGTFSNGALLLTVRNMINTAFGVVDQVTSNDTVQKANDAETSIAALTARLDAVEVDVERIGATEQAIVDLATSSGAVYNPFDTSSLIQARDGTGPNAVAGSDPVGVMLDKAHMGGMPAATYLALNGLSANPLAAPGVHLIAPSDNERPRLHSSGRLLFGPDDVLVADAPGFSVADVVVGVHAEEITPVNFANFVVLAPASGGTEFEEPSVVLLGTNNGGDNIYIQSGRATNPDQVDEVEYGEPPGKPTPLAVYMVERNQLDHRLRVNGTVVASGSYSAVGTAHTGPLVLGGRFINNVVGYSRLEGTIGRVVIAPVVMTEDQIATLNTWLGS